MTVTVLTPDQIEDERLLWLRYPDAQVCTPKKVLRALSRVPRQRVVVVPSSSRDYRRLYMAILRSEPIRRAAYLERNRERDRQRYAKEKAARPPKPPHVVQSKGRSRFRADRPKWILWREQQLERQGWRCAMCQCDLHSVERHVDHIVPRSQGGKAVESNLWILCRPCNQSKKAKRLFLL